MKPLHVVSVRLTKSIQVVVAIGYWSEKLENNGKKADFMFQRARILDALNFYNLSKNKKLNAAMSGNQNRYVRDDYGYVRCK